jgi:hypothetical protein
MTVDDREFVPLAVIESYDQVHEFLRRRWIATGTSLERVDEIAGTPDRWASKVLSPGRKKTCGLSSLLLLAGALGVALVLAEDPAQVRRVRGRWDRATTKRSRARGRKSVLSAMQRLSACVWCFAVSVRHG